MSLLESNQTKSLLSSTRQTAMVLLMIIFSLTTAVRVSAQVKAWGRNNAGQLGVGNFNTPLPSPAAISNSGDITGISAGEGFTLFLKADGTVMAAGDNTFGQLGDGTNTIRNTPVPVVNLWNVVAISAGQLHSLALLADGTVWAWGRNYEGQLGLGFGGIGQARNTPNQVINLTNVVAIAANGPSLALKSDGTVWAWGSNSDGQLGDGTTPNFNPHSTPTQVGVGVAGFNNMIAISAGANHAVALKSDGTVWVWGSNVFGEGGNGAAGGNQLSPVQTTNIAGVSQIVAGWHLNYALKPDGTLFAWGYNLRGNIGDGTTVSAGCQCIPAPTKTAITNVVDIKATDEHALARKTDGSVWAWGWNRYGQMGDGTTSTTDCQCRWLPGQVTALGTGNSIISAGYFQSFSAKPSATTPTGNNVRLHGEVLNFLFTSVSDAGTTSYTAFPPLSTGLDPGSFSIVPNSPGYDITSTAALSGDVEVCLKVPTEYDETTFNSLVVLHGEGPNLVERTLSLDYLKREICANVTSLSPFVLAQTPPESPGHLQFASAAFSANESAGTATINVTRTGGRSGAGAVNYATSNGTAVGGSSCGPGIDYITSSGTLNWADGDSANKTIIISICNDDVDEDVESINFTLSNATGVTTLGAPSSSTLTVENDDQPPDIIINDVSLSEGNAGTTDFTFNVSLSHASTQEVTVLYQTLDDDAEDASDYQYQEGTLTFAPGETVNSVTVLVNGDPDIEPDEAFLLELSSPTNATIIDPDGVATIINDDSACGYSITPTSQNFTGTGGTDSVSVTAGTGCAWTAVSNDAWIVVTSGSSGTGDGTTNYSVALNSGAARIGTITIASKTITVTQDGAPQNLQFASAVSNVGESAGSAAITVTRTGGSVGTVSVNYATSNGTASGGGCGPGIDYVTSSGTLTWLDGDSANKTFNVSVCTDNIDENDETINLTLSNATGGATLGTPSFATLTITDDDAAPNISINDASLAEGNAGTSALMFNVGLSHPSSLQITVSYQTMNGQASNASDYQNANGTLTFSPGETLKTIAVLVNGDGEVEPDETFTVNLSAPANAVITDSDGLGTIINDDTCAYLVAPSSQHFVGAGGTGSVGVTAVTGCAWTAISNDAWIVITSGSNGAGNGAVNYSVAVNPGPARLGTITIAGQTFTVTQDGITTGVFQITQSVIAGGGGKSTGGTYVLDGTSGQCLAGTESTGGSFSLLSGFWGPSNMALASGRAPFDFGGDINFGAIIFRPLSRSY